MTDESEHICYGDMRIVIPLPIEKQVAIGNADVVEEPVDPETPAE